LANDGTTMLRRSSHMPVTTAEDAMKMPGMVLSLRKVTGGRSSDSPTEPSDPWGKSPDRSESGTLRLVHKCADFNRLEVYPHHRSREPFKALSHRVGVIDKMLPDVLPDGSAVVRVILRPHGQSGNRKRTANQRNWGKCPKAIGWYPPAGPFPGLPRTVPATAPSP